MTKVRQAFQALTAMLAIHTITRAQKLEAMNFEKGMKLYSIFNSFFVKRKEKRLEEESYYEIDVVGTAVKQECTG